MHVRNILYLSGAMLASAIAGSLIGPRPVMAVAREIIELQRDVTSILQGQKDLQTQMTQDHTVQKTLIEQSSDTVNKLNTTMSSLQKSVQDVQANSGTRLDTIVHAGARALGQSRRDQVASGETQPATGGLAEFGAEH